MLPVSNLHVIKLTELSLLEVKEVQGHADALVVTRRDAPHAHGVVGVGARVAGARDVASCLQTVETFAWKGKITSQPTNVATSGYCT